MRSPKAKHRQRFRPGIAVAALYLVPALAAVFALVAMSAQAPDLNQKPVLPVPAAPASDLVQTVAANVSASGGAASQQVDPAWLERQAGRTGINPRALAAYAWAELLLGRTKPECKLGWTTLAGIGWIESGHGTGGGGELGRDGVPSQAIVGPALDGTGGHAAIAATEATTAATGDPDWDHAVGPLQFIGSTWSSWGVDANGDGVADPNNIDDAAVTAGLYLCSAGGDLSTGEGWSKAIHAYNHSDAYVDAVRNRANFYAG